jgi:hypothetical protein
MPEILPWDHTAIKLPESRAVASVETSPMAEEVVILNDDVMIEVAPIRACGTIRVRLVFAGRSTPIPTDDPWAE